MIKICVCQPQQAFHPAFAGQVPAFAGQIPAFVGQIPAAVGGEMSSFYSHGVVDY